MNTMLTEYNLEKETLKNMLIRNRGIIAGSFPLYCFLKQNGIDPGFTPNDLDIWIPRRGSIWEVERYLRDKGYARTDKFDRQNTYNHTGSQISSVYSYTRQNKEIQIISIKADDCLKYIKDTFDISCCMTWWNHMDDSLENYEPELTLKKEMKLFNRNDKTCLRVIKYEKRGYVLTNEERKKDRFAKILPVYKYYCNVKGFNSDRDKRFLRPKICKTYNAVNMIRSLYLFSTVNPLTTSGVNKMFDNVVEDFGF